MLKSLNDVYDSAYTHTHPHTHTHTRADNRRVTGRQRQWAGHESMGGNVKQNKTHVNDSYPHSYPGDWAASVTAARTDVRRHTEPRHRGSHDNKLPCKNTTP